jgi:M6 family metalloprotease-like protein
LTREKQGDAAAFIQSAIMAADSAVNFTDVDIVVAVTPPEITNDLIEFSPAIPLSSDNGFRTAEGNVYRGTLAGADTRWEEGHLLLAHEIGHLLGLDDYYSYEWTAGEPYEEQFKFMGEFDNMNFAPGKAREWTGWSRWLLGTLDDNQVRCVTDATETTHQLWAISDSEPEAKIVVIPTSDTSAVVIESRKSRRNDHRLNKTNEGLLVYSVDTTKKNGFGPLRIIRKENLPYPFLLDAPLRPGEFVTIDGYKIENVESGTLWDVARVTKIEE